MSEKDADKKNKEIEEMKEETPRLKEIAFKNYYRLLLKEWLMPIGVFVSGIILGLILYYFIVPKALFPFNTLKAEEIARNILAPSVTMNGLFITFVPVISFFYIQEIKEQKEQIKEEQREKEREFERKEDLKVVNSSFNLAYVFWNNVKSGILKYLKIYLIISIISLFMLVYVYVLVDSFLFILVDTFLQFTVFTGIFPIINMALYRPSIKLVRYVIPERIVENIEYE
jgi:hypothetical protein